MGRFVARWYLTAHHGAGAFLPIDRDDFSFFVPNLDIWFKVSRRFGERGDLPDWLWAAPPVALHQRPSVGFLEAKGTYYRNQLARSLEGAHTQLRQLVVRQGPTGNGPWTTVRNKNWAVATGWATVNGIERGFHRPTVRVEDPETEGELLDDHAARGLFTSVARAQSSQTLDGLGAPIRSEKLRSLISMPVSRASDSGRRAVIWQREDAVPGREILGVEIRPFDAQPDEAGWVAALDQEAVEALSSSDASAMEAAEKQITDSFVLLRRSQVQRLRDDGSETTIAIP